MRRRERATAAGPRSPRQPPQRAALAHRRRHRSSAPASSTTIARISECSVHAAWITSAGQRTASPAAIRVRSSPTPTQPPPSMTMNQVVFGLACGSIRRAAGEGELGDDAAAVAVDDLAGHPGRARRPVRPSVADPEAADLDRHRRAGGSRGSAGGAAAAGRRAAGWSPRGRRTSAGEVALAGQPRLVGREDRREAAEPDPDQRRRCPMTAVAAP